MTHEALQDSTHRNADRIRDLNRRLERENRALKDRVEALEKAVFPDDQGGANLKAAFISNTNQLIKLRHIVEVLQAAAKKGEKS